MPEYDVNLYCTVRLKQEKIQAETMEEAIAKAEDQVDLSHVFRGTGDGWTTEYADDITAALVDVVGDEEYELTECFVPNYDWEIKKDWLPELPEERELLHQAQQEIRRARRERAANP